MQQYCNSGYRIVITDQLPAVGQDGSHPRHISGGQAVSESGERPSCPNCRQPLFPVLKLDNRDPRVAELALWNGPTIQVLVCPACALYMEPCWVRYRSGVTSIYGGERDDGLRLQEIEVPYEERLIELRPLADGEGSDCVEALVALIERRVEQGIYHQIGGKPFKTCDDKVLRCVSCEQPMKFAGVVDYDDLNVPLYEPVRRPTSLIFGDLDCLNWYTCRSCDVIGTCWARMPAVSL